MRSLNPTTQLGREEPIIAQAANGRAICWTQFCIACSEKAMTFYSKIWQILLPSAKNSIFWQV